VSTPDRHLSIVIYSPFPRDSGGRENWLFHVIRRLDAAGYRVDLYSYDVDAPPFYDLASLPQVRQHTVRTLRRRRRLFGLLNKATLNLAFLCDTLVFTYAVYRRLRAHHPAGAAILAMNPVVDVAPALLYRRRDPSSRVACSVRGRVAWELSRRSPWLGWLFRRLERGTLRASDYVLANGYDTQEYLTGIGIDSRVVPNGVDVARFRSPDDDPAARWVREQRAAGRVVVMMVATLWPVKGVQYLIQAAGLLREMGVDGFSVVLVGKGPQEPYRRLAEQAGAGDCVHFAGEQRNVAAFLQWADISVNLSDGGGMSMAAIESLAAGTAVVAWDTPIYRQLIQDGRSGVLVPPKDVRALAHALRGLIEDPERRRALGAQAQAAAQQYDWSIVVRELLDALRLPVPSPA
jgi:glycosyltransferase involved in cell wall biosynthesis